MTKPIDNITAERLREVLSYDPVTGIFHWLKSLSARAMAGAVAGSLKPSGYICINIDGNRHRAHRLAWIYMTGKAPAKMVDHRDNIRHHNWWSNLREADNQQNGANSRRKHFGTSGYKGVGWSKQRQKWMAKITVSRRQIHIGFYESKEEAAAAYARAARTHFGEFARDDAPCTIVVDLAEVRRFHAWNAKAASLQAFLDARLRA